MLSPPCGLQKGSKIIGNGGRVIEGCPGGLIDKLEEHSRSKEFELSARVWRTWWSLRDLPLTRAPRVEHRPSNRSYSKATPGLAIQEMQMHDPYPIAVLQAPKLSRSANTHAANCRAVEKVLLD